MNMKKRLFLWITGFLLLGLAGCKGDTIEFYEGKRRNFGVDVLVSTQYGKQEVLVRDAVAVKLSSENYENCIKVYVNPHGDKREVALARCGSGTGFRVEMRSELVEVGWQKKPRYKHNDFIIDFGDQSHYEEQELVCVGWKTVQECISWEEPAEPEGK